MFPSPFGEMFEKDGTGSEAVRPQVLFPSPFGEMFEKGVNPDLFGQGEAKFPSPFGEMFEKAMNYKFMQPVYDNGFHPLSGKCLKKTILCNLYTAKP